MIGSLINKKDVFDSFFWKSCFYNALFTAMNHWNVDISPILQNVYLHIQTNSQNGLVAEYQNVSNEIKELRNLGINIELLEDFCDYRTRINYALEKGGFIIINIDWFYHSYQKRIYAQKHRWHKVLVCGAENDKYYYWDQEHADVLYYTLQAIDCDELIGSNRDSLSRYGNSGIWEVTYLSNKTRQVKSKEILCLQNYFEQYLAINKLKKITCWKRKQIIKENIISINKIISFKKSQLYVLYKRGVYNKYLGLLEEELSAWNQLRNCMLIFEFYNDEENKQKEFIDVINQLTKILKVLADIKEGI